jgi:transposase InsO family protein
LTASFAGFGRRARSIGVPLGRQSTIVQRPTAGHGISSQFPRDGRWRTVQALGDCAYAADAGALQRDVLSVNEGQIAARQWGLVDRRHAPTVPDRAVWPTRQHAKTAIFHYVEGFYNRLRRHSTLNYRSPDAYEADYLAAILAA